MSSTCQTIHYDASQYSVYIYPFTILYLYYQSRNGKGRVMCCFCALYTGQFPSLLSSFLPRSFLAPLPARFLPSFPRSVHAHVPSSLVPFLNPPSPTSALTLPHITASSLLARVPSLPHPPLAPCHPPSFLALSLRPPACLPPVVQFSVHRMCVWQVALYCVAPSHGRHRDNEVFAPEEGVVSMARCYLQRTCSHHESVFDEE